MIDETYAPIIALEKFRTKHSVYLSSMPLIFKLMDEEKMRIILGDRRFIRKLDRFIDEDCHERYLDVREVVELISQEITEANDLLIRYKKQS